MCYGVLCEFSGFDFFNTLWSRLSFGKPLTVIFQLGFSKEQKVICELGKPIGRILVNPEFRGPCDFLEIWQLHRKKDVGTKCL